MRVGGSVNAFNGKHGDNRVFQWLYLPVITQFLLIFEFYLQLSAANRPINIIKFEIHQVIAGEGPDELNAPRLSGVFYIQVFVWQ